MRPRRSPRRDFVIWFALIAVALGLYLLQAPASPPAAAAAGAYRVIDGDTLADRATDERIRVANIDTPETGARARCAAEARAGARATAAARALIANARDVRVIRLGRVDVYGRTIARVRVDGADFGDTLIARGLARPWRGRREPWCGANGELRRA